MNMNKPPLLQTLVAALGFSAIPAHAVTPTTWTTAIDAATYNGSVGSITFNDWGYKGPTGVGANDFQVGTGFDAGNIGQIQHVLTRAPDWKTPDSPKTVVMDLGTTEYVNANMDGTVNFYKWGYTTPVNSTFSNMKIDKAGNYSIAKNDMSFGFYDRFQYRDTAGNFILNDDTRINFQPYTISDAQGWCGSVLNADPNGVGVMAGQVTFDFAFDVFLNDGTPATGVPQTQLISDFVMRSYGDYVINVTTNGGDQQYFTGRAVGNNMNPLINPLDANGELTGAALDPAYNNLVSFLGAGVIPTGQWVSADSFNPDGSRKMRSDFNPTTGKTNLVWDVTVVAAGTPGAIWHANSFAGYAYLLRADGSRTLDFISPTGHSIYTSAAVVPLPAAAWLFGSGLLGLGAIARRRARSTR